MLIAIRALRVLLGVIAAWQAIGLLPTVTWLPHLGAVTTGMAAGVAFKIIVLVVCVALYRWLGRKKTKYGSHQEKMGDASIAGVVLVAGVCIVVVAALVFPSAPTPAAARSGAVGEVQGHRRDTAQTQPDAAIWGSFAAEGWTQESTNSAEAGPWLNYDPPGTRYCRYANGIIQRVYPPGVRPNAPKANPFCLHDSTALVQQ